MENLRQEMLQDDERKHFILYADKFSIKIAVNFAIFFVCCPTFSFASNTVLDVMTGSETPHLLLQIWVPWNITDLQTYLWASLLAMVCTFSAVAIFLAFTTFNYIFTFEMSAFLQVLQSKFETLQLDDKDVYRLHREIMRLLREYNKIFSGQMYMEIIISSLQPCGFGYSTIKALKTNDIRAIDLLYKFVLATLASFVLCACGQEISTQLEKLHASSYMCNWYEEKPASRRYLLQVMSVTLKPTAVNFRKVVVFNYVCFASVAQGIYSYLMMVNQLEEKN